MINHQSLDPEMNASNTYTTDNKVTWYFTEDDINEKLVSILGQKFVDYRKKWDAVNRFELETDFPLYLQVELHQICNLRCPMCSITVPEANSKYITDKHMSWDTYKKIILEAEKYMCPSLNPQGVNEPLLDRELEDYIKFASNHGFFDIIMNSNATLLSEERSKKILESGLTRLRFSLDAATKETYEKIRVGAKYDVVMRNIERFVELRNRGGYELPVLGVNLVKMKLNEHEIDLFIDKWKDVVDFIAIQEFIPPETESDYSMFYPTESKFRDDMMNGFNCQQPWQRFYIHNTGEVCPCCAFFNSELSVGNVKDHSIYELWNSDSMHNLRQLHKEGKYWDNPWCLKCVNSICGKPGSTELLNIQKTANPK